MSKLLSHIFAPLLQYEICMLNLRAKNLCSSKILQPDSSPLAPLFRYRQFHREWAQSSRKNAADAVAACARLHRSRLKLLYTTSLLRTISFLALSASTPPRYKNCCIEYGVVSPRASAICHPFLRSISLIKSLIYLCPFLNPDSLAYASPIRLMISLNSLSSSSTFGFHLSPLLRSSLSLLVNLDNCNIRLT